MACFLLQRREWSVANSMTLPVMQIGIILLIGTFFDVQGCSNLCLAVARSRVDIGDGRTVQCSLFLGFPDF